VFIPSPGELVPRWPELADEGKLLDGRQWDAFLSSHCPGRTFSSEEAVPAPRRQSGIGTLRVGLAGGAATESGAVLVTPRLQGLACHADVDNGMNVLVVLGPDVDEAFTRRRCRELVTEYAVFAAKKSDFRNENSIIWVSNAVLSICMTLNCVLNVAGAQIAGLSSIEIDFPVPVNFGCWRHAVRECFDLDSAGG